MMTVATLHHRVHWEIRVAAAALALATIPAFAGGLFLYEVGTPDVALASAGYGARAQDASTIFTNPAGMTRLDGTQSTFGAQLLYGDVAYTGTQTANTASGGDGGMPIGWLPGLSAFVSHAVSDRFRVGIGMAGNLGLTLEYDQGWAGRYYAGKSTLLGLSLLPSVAYRVTPQLSVGAGLTVMYGILKNRVAVNNVAPGAADGSLEVSDRSWGVGANLGALYEPDARTRIGLTYTSPVKLDFRATAGFSGLASGLESLLQSRGLLGANLDLGITVPQTLMLSGYREVNDRWAVLASAGWQQWSEFGRVELGVDSNDPTSLTKDLHYRDTWHLAAGAQYRLPGGTLLNFGIAYDSPFTDSSNISPVAPANDNWRFGLGAQGQMNPKFGWGASVEYAYGGTLHVNRTGGAPVALGGRGDLVGSYENAGVIFIAGTLNWKP